MRKPILGALALLASFAALPAAADTVRFTLTHNELPGSISWLLPASPTPELFETGVAFGVEGPIPSRAENEGEAIDVVFEDFGFFTDAFGGGFSTTVIFELPDELGALDEEFFFLDLSGDQLFTGDVEAPTFKLGSFQLAEEDCGCGGFSSSFGAEASSFSHETYTLTISAAVPEPAAWGLMIAGFAAAGAVLRRRRPVEA